MNTMITVKVESVFAANVLTNSTRTASAELRQKVGMGRKTGKVIMTIAEANELSKSLETYAKTTKHEPSAKMARSIAFGCRQKTARVCNAIKAAQAQKA